MAKFLKPLTILHTESSLGWGGQEHRILLEAGVLRARGHRLLLAADPRGELFRRGRDRGFQVVPLPFRQKIKAGLALRRLLRDAQVDMLNTHSSLDSWVATLAWASLRSRPVLVRTRHLSTPVSPNPFTRWLYHAPAAVITTSREIADLLHRRLGVPRERLHAIPTGVSLTDFAPRPPRLELREELNLPAEACVLGTVSVLRSWKGHLYVLDAVKTLISQGLNVYLLIVGEGPFRPRIEEKIAHLHLQSRVRLVGHQERVADWLALMDVFVMASYANEGVPQSLLQALAMARAVAATRVGGIPEVITDGRSGLLVPPRDAGALAGALMRLCRDALLRQELGRRGREVAAAGHSLEGMADRVEEVYAEILAETHQVVVK
jgi:glycosyltransferase involved in cell wall biosynthesis